MSSTTYIGKYDDAGSRNTFYRLNNRRYGFKSFETKALAEFAFRVQSYLSTIDLAPKVYGEVGRINVVDSFGDKELSDWGYLTEIAKTLPECYDDDCDGECHDCGCENSCMISDIVAAMEENGLSYVDAHRGNFGYIRRNRQWIMVVIDVGYESFDYFDSSIYGPDPNDDENNVNSSGCDCSICKRYANV